MHAARSGDFGPLIFYLVMVVFCLGLVLDVGQVNSRIERELKTRRLGRLYRNVPTWMFRLSPLAGLAMITVVMVLIHDPGRGSWAVRRCR